MERDYKKNHYVNDMHSTNYFSNKSKNNNADYSKNDIKLQSLLSAKRKYSEEKSLNNKQTNNVDIEKKNKVKNILNCDSSDESEHKKKKDIESLLNHNEKPKDKFGKYGILNNSNLFNKMSEFRLWLKEIKNLGEGIREENYYAEFIDNFNNCKLPDKKFYDLAKYESLNIIKRMKKNKSKIKEKFLGGEDEGFVFNDEARKEYEKKLAKETQIRSKLDEIYKNLDDKRITEMKEQAYQNKLMIQYYKTGHESSARDIHSKYYSQANIKKKEKEAKEIAELVPNDVDE